MAKDPVCNMYVDGKKAGLRLSIKEKLIIFVQKVPQSPSLPSAILRTGLIATTEPRDAKSHLLRTRRSIWEKRKKVTNIDYNSMKVSFPQVTH